MELVRRLVPRAGTFPSRYTSTFVIGGTSNPDLTEKLASHFDTPAIHLSGKFFSNSETRVPPLSSVIQPGSNVLIVQSPCTDTNNELFQVFLTARQCHQIGCNRIVAVLPVFPYARSDKSEFEGYPVGARFVSDALVVAGVNHIVTVDLHAPQTEGCFSCSYSHIPSTVISAPWLHQLQRNRDVILVAPDAGAMKTVTRLSRLTGGTPSVFMNKVRDHTTGNISEMKLVGDVRGRSAIIVDDIGDSCGTVLTASSLLKDSGARDVSAFLTHGVFSGRAVERINECEEIDHITTTNTINQQDRSTRPSKIRVLDISRVLYEHMKTLLNS